MNIQEKLEILANAAKYDVSCASSGSRRENRGGGLGNSVSGGICHSFTEDGRCVSLLKILFTNYCIYDCAYCANRSSNDIPRAAFTPSELADLTIDFYRRNFIEGLFLSSGVVRSPDETMEKLIRTVRDLRARGFNGYIHLKCVPYMNRRLIRWEHLRQMGVALKRAAPFIVCPGQPASGRQIQPEKRGTGAPVLASRQGAIALQDLHCRQYS
jgi:predicted DNA-binding helix-hairpin-helix protein